jgi:hypothetical protein
MKYHNTIFNQLLNMLPRYWFEQSVKSIQANRYTKHFTAWNQLLVNLYAQVSGKKSLRDIETGLKMQQNSWYHLGLTNAVRSTISYANNKRPYQIAENTFYHLLEKCRDVTPKHKFRFKNPLYTLDATVIDLCLSMFPWAKFRKRKGALKIHTLLDHRGTIPSFMVITDAKQHEVKVAQNLFLPVSLDSIITVDKAYVDFQWLYGLKQRGLYFVTRAKETMNYRVVGQQEVNSNKGLLADKEIRLTGFYTSKKYPEKLRLVIYHDSEHDKTYQFLTNNFHLAAYTIAQIYKARWQVELFFKWIKQNLKIKTFLGTSKNAVLTQIWTAMIYYLLLAYIKYQTKYKHSLLYLTRVIKECLFKRADIIDLLNLSLEKAGRERAPCYEPSLF